jgi:hypothetical protein
MWGKFYIWVHGGVWLIQHISGSERKAKSIHGFDVDLEGV